MFRVLLIPILLITCTVLISALGYFALRKIKRGISTTYNKSAELSHKLHQQWKEKWREKEQRQKLPDIVQMGYEDYETIKRTIKKLPAEWQQKLLPLQEKAHLLLLQLSHHVASDEQFENSKLSSFRPFFIHSLDTLKQLSQKIASDHKNLSAAEISRADENIRLIAEDLARHEKRLHKKRKLDFEVLMDVIKARLKS